MALEDDTKKLYDLYQSDPKIKSYINSLPQDQWMPELRRLYGKGNGSGFVDTCFNMAAMAALFAGLMYMI